MLRISASVAMLGFAVVLWRLLLADEFSPPVGCVVLIGIGTMAGLAIGLLVRWPKTCTTVGAVLAVAYIAFLYAQITLLIPPNGD